MAISRRSLQSTILLQKKKEMHQIQEALEKKRIEFTKRINECREKRDLLKVKVNISLFSKNKSGIVSSNLKNF